MKFYTSVLSVLASTCFFKWEWISRLKTNGFRYQFEWEKAQKKVRKVSLDKPLMNCKAIGNQAYVPTELEHIANVITHGLWVLPSLVGFYYMIQKASNRTQYLSAVVYGCATVALFTISTVFHCVFYVGRFRSLKEFLHRCDRAVIYLFIAASYTPWLTLKQMVPSYCTNIQWLVWICACLGIVYQQLYHERYKWLETVLYLILGLFPSIAIINMPEWSGLYELAMGGAIYIFGIYFFKSDGCIPCAHAIWHIFVVIGATFHYYAVYKYLMGKTTEVLTLT